MINNLPRLKIITEKTIKCNNEVNSLHKNNIKPIYKKIDNKNASLSLLNKTSNIVNKKVIKGKIYSAFNKKTHSSIPNKIETFLTRNKNIFNKTTRGFSSQSERFDKLLYKDSYKNIGPGSYNIDKLNTIKKNTSMIDNISFNNSKGFGNGFISSSERFNYDNLLKSKYTPGPGDYSVLSNINNKTNSSIFSTDVCSENSNLAFGKTYYKNFNKLLSNKIINKRLNLIDIDNNYSRYKKKKDNINKIFDRHVNINNKRLNIKNTPDFSKSKLQRTDFTKLKTKTPGPCCYFVNSNDSKNDKDKERLNVCKYNNIDTIQESEEIIEYKNAIKKTHHKINLFNKNNTKDKRNLSLKNIYEFINRSKNDRKFKFMNNNYKNNEKLMLNTFMHLKTKYNQGKSSYFIDKLEKYIPIYHYNISSCFDKYLDNDLDKTCNFVSTTKRELTNNKLSNKYPGPAYYNTAKKQY